MFKWHVKNIFKFKNESETALILFLVHFKNESRPHETQIKVCYKRSHIFVDNYLVYQVFRLNLGKSTELIILITLFQATFLGWLSQYLKLAWNLKLTPKAYPNPWYTRYASGGGWGEWERERGLPGMSHVEMRGISVIELEEENTRKKRRDVWVCLRRRFGNNRSIFRCLDEQRIFSPFFKT